MILYGNEHQIRANNLGTALREVVAEMAPLAAGGPIPACNDNTLTIWGHGGPMEFAELTAGQFAAFIQRWKTRNPSFNTLELVTCDARHLQNDTDSFTDKLMPLLITGGKTLVTVKCPPRGGSKAMMSELTAINVVGADGYGFIAAEDDESFTLSTQLLLKTYNDLNPATPAPDKFAAAWVIFNAAVKKLAMKGPLKFVSSSGPFSKLRGFLVPVTAYNDHGTVKAVPKTLTA